ncbi:MAG: hypothetical protein LKI39_12165 [Bacteroides sp.]|jgi:hypothetical protein|nr:hypothetical protein [Bacteroides sp.]
MLNEQVEKPVLGQGREVTDNLTRDKMEAPAMGRQGKFKLLGHYGLIYFIDSVSDE